MRALPDGWEWSTVGEAGAVSLGRQRHPKWHTGPNMRPYLRVANVFEDRIDTSDLKEMDFSGEGVFDRFKLVPGDVLLNEGQSLELVGRPAIYRGVPEEVAFTNTLVRFRPIDRVTSEWALAVFRHYMHSGRFAKEARITTNIAHLSAKRLAAIKFPIPSLAEQHHIVEIVEGHLSRLDAAERSLTEARRRLIGLRRALLADAIPEPSCYPGSWIHEVVGNVGVVELGRQRHPDWHAGPNMKPYLRVANVFEDRIDTSDVMEMHWPDGSFERFRLNSGDVLLNEGQSPELIGRPALYRGVPEQVAFTNSLIRFKAGERVLPEFALVVFRRHMHAGRFRQEARITTNIGHLSASRLKKVDFPVPPLAEQSAIVSKVNGDLASIARTEQSLKTFDTRNRALRRAVFAAAFDGRLTGHRVDEEIIEESVENDQESRAS